MFNDEPESVDILDTATSVSLYNFKIRMPSLGCEFPRSDNMRIHVH